MHDAIEARKTRFTNQVFPQSGRYVEVITDESELPQAKLALLDHYVERARLREDIIPAMFKTGDIEGQYNLYVDWREVKRHVTTRTVKGPTVMGVELEAEDVGEDEQIEDVKDEVVIDFGPTVDVLPDNDILVLPPIANSVEEALHVYGGTVTIMRRWSKAMIEQKIKDEEIDEEAGEELIERMDDAAKENTRRDMMKEHVDSAGIKSSGKYTQVYETWQVLDIDDEKRLVRTYYGGPDTILGSRLNPFWCDLCPLISHPVDKVGGAFKGISKVHFVDKLQYLANDFLNQGADSASYALLPIIMTDPTSNPRVGSMVVDLAAVWEVDPRSTKFAEFPPLWKDAMALVQGLTQQIFQTLGVNPSMVPQRSSTKKPTQAEIAAEQQVDIMTTADVIIPLEAGMLTPMLQRFIEYDAQFRRESLWVASFGREGQKSGMQEVPPQQRQNRVKFKWWGVEQARNERQMQMAGLNVLRQIPPQMLGGRQLDFVPLIERFVEATYGPRLGPLIFKPLSDTIGMPPEEENGLLMQSIDLPVAPTDDDRKHLQVHAQLLQAGPQVQERVKAHMFKHQQQMGAKNAAAAQQQGGGQPQPGGQPRPGAATSGPRNQGPPGMIHQDQMPGGMPRKPA